MKFFALSKNFRLADWGKRLSHLTPEDLAVWGAIILGIFLVSIIILDGYLFYAAVFKEKAQPAAAQRTPILSSLEIDEAIKILDEREKRFEELLRGK